jgi:opine dehydrogenase
METNPVFNHKCSVAILGAGHGGLALAGYLSQRGHRVALWNRSPERIAPVEALGGVRLTLPGSGTIFAPVAIATNYMSAALSDARRILVAVPASGHSEIARRCAPHLRDGQTVLLLPGRTGGALEFRRVLREAGCRARILLGEANTFPFACRSAGSEALLYGIKAEVLAAALPADRTPALLDAWRPLLPMLAPADSVLHTGFTNLGAILHPVITLLNAERIRRGDVFDFYTEGVTPAVAATLADADAERLRIARAYGATVCPLRAWVASAYGHHADTVLGAVGGNPAYVGIKAPTHLEHRYLLEDLPTGLIPLIELGRAAGLAAPTLRGLVERGRVALGGQRWQNPRTLDALGLNGLDAESIRAFVAGGFVPVGKAAAPTPARPFAYTHFGSGLELIPQV